MATVLETRPASKPTLKPAPPTVEQIIERTPVVPASPDPWYEDRREYAVPAASLVFGVRVRHVSRPGLWKIVRAAERRDSTSRYYIRVRLQAADGSLVGAVESWTLDQVAALATADETKAEPAPVAVQAESPATFAATADRLVVEMDVTINGTAYRIEPIANAPGGTRSYRLGKHGGDLAVYDVDAFAGRVECSCPSYRKTHAGTSSLCKHGRALVMVGLVDYPAAPEPDPRDHYNDAREKLAALEAAEAEVRREGQAPAPCCDPADEPAPCTACATAHTLPDDLSGDDWSDGWRWELGPVVGPEDVVDMRTWDPALDAEDDDERMTLTTNEGHSEPEPDRRRLAEQVDVEARHYRTLGTAFGDLLAETIEKLAAEVRYLDAGTPDAYRDRREAALDAAEARMASARCC